MTYATTWVSAFTCVALLGVEGVVAARPLGRTPLTDAIFRSGASATPTADSNHRPERLSITQPPLSGASPAWDDLRALAPKTWIKVNTDTDIDLTGRLVAVGDDSLQLQTHGKVVRALTRASVREVRRVPHLNTAGAFAFGLLAGAGVGYLAGSAAACDPSTCDAAGLYVAAGVVYGTMGGGISGFVAARVANTRPGTVIYTRPRVESPDVVEIQ